MSDLQKVLSDYVVEMIDRRTIYEIMIKPKNKHLYIKHQRNRQIDNLKRMTFGRQSKKERCE